jgi:hypothetical protein
MAPGSPITFTLYGPDDAVISTHSRATITSRFLERAIDLSEAMEDTSQVREALNALDQLLVDFYGGQFTLDQIKDGGDMSEKMTVLNAILARAGGIMQMAPASNGSAPSDGDTRPAANVRNPTKPGKTRRQRAGT